MKKKRFVFNKTQKAALSLILSKEMLSDIESIESDDKADSGEAYIEFTLKDGKIAKVDTEGFTTLDGEQMPAGEHPLANGTILVVDESGNFVETKEATATTTEPSEATAPETLRRKQKLAIEKAKQLKAKQKLAEENGDADTVDALKAKIADLESIISDLTSKADEAETKIEEAQTEIAELKKKTPSATPVVQPLEKVDMSKMSHSDRLAYSAKLAMNRRKK